MNKTIAFLIAMSAGLVRFAQSTSPEVIGSSGEHYSGTNAQLSWTIGETVNEAYSAVNNQLTQGFHQTNLTTVGMEDLNEDIQFSVYPNPVAEQLTLESGNTYDEYTIQLFVLFFTQNINSFAK